MVIVRNDLPPTGSRKKSRTLNILLAILFAYLGIVWIAIMYFAIGRPFLTPKVRVIIEPDWTKVITVENVDLEESAEILRTRWKALGYGYPWATFRVNNNGKIIGMVPKKVDTEFINKTMIFGIVEFVDLGSNFISPDTLINTDANNRYFQQTNSPIYHTVLTNAGIQNIYVSVVSRYDYAVDFTLTEVGKRAFASHTANNVGNFLAITVDKVVVSCPEISNAIIDGEVQISGSFTETEANDLVSILKSPPLPIPLKWIVIQNWFYP